MRRLTDGTGIYQHARYSVPNPHFGYTTDDNARALLVALRAYRQSSQIADLNLAYRYLTFLIFAQTETGLFHNELSYDRKWLDEVGSADSQGRAAWALGYTAARAPESGLRLLALEALAAFRPVLLNTLQAPRPVAFALLGLCELVEVEPSWQAEIEQLASRLYAWYAAVSSPEWPWFEEIMTYDNARLPQAMLRAAPITRTSEYQQASNAALDFLLKELTSNGVVDLVGNRGWYPQGGPRAIFDQQPVDAAALVETCLDAARLTGERRYRLQAEHVFAWFLGHNRLGLPMVDPYTGGCFDGLNVDGVNHNQGAESTLAHLQARLALEEADWARWCSYFGGRTFHEH